MSSSRRHPLHRVALRNAQVLVHRRLQWIDCRQRAYDLRDSRDADFFQRIRAASSATDREVIEALHHKAYSQIKAVIDCYNFGPIDAVEGGKSSAQLQAALIYLAFGAAVADGDIAAAQALQLALAADLDVDPSPPGFALRATPRRPGAPSATPALINPLLDQCGSARAAPEISRLS